MENVSLVGLLEADREMIMASLTRDRAPAAVQTALEKALDRVMLRHAEACPDGRTRDAAQMILSSLKSALPLVDLVGEVRRWQKTAGASGRSKPGALVWAALAGGALLVLASVMGLAFAGGRAGALAPLKAAVPAVLGMAGVFWAGTKWAKPPKGGAADAPSDYRDEYLVDAEKLWHHLRGMLLVADGALENLRAQSAAEAQRAERAAAEGPLDRAQLELFAGLLEGLYAQSGPDAREMAESIRFYLHGARVEVVDQEAGREEWFETLPSVKSGTIRPALVSEGRLIKKGLAAARQMGR